MKLHRVDVVFASLVFSLTAFCFIPLSIFLTNRESFMSGSVYVVACCLFLSGVVFFILAAVAMSIRDSLRPWAISIVAALTLVFWLQSNVFNWDYGVLDGSELPWKLLDWRSIVDIGTWIALPLVILMYGVTKKHPEFQRFLYTMFQ